MYVKKNNVSYKGYVNIGVNVEKCTTNSGGNVPTFYEQMHATCMHFFMRYPQVIENVSTNSVVVTLEYKSSEEHSGAITLLKFVAIKCIVCSPIIDVIHDISLNIFFGIFSNTCK